jgi:hypothetical protein
LNVAYFNEGKEKLLVYSSKSGRGRKELWQKIINRMETCKPEDSQ